MKNWIVLCLAGSLLAGCNDERNAPGQNLNLTPKLAYSFPEQYNTPDGLALAPDNSMLLSINNAGNPVYPAAILRLTDQGYALFATPPANPVTGKASPFDIAYGPDGNVYYNDNQFNNNPNNQSRVMRIRIVNGQPTAIEPVVINLRLANGMVWKGNTLYVTDSQWDLPGIDNGSAIFKFTIDDLNNGPVAVQPRTLDPHILTTFTTNTAQTGDDLGCDGIDYDSQGNLVTGLFGDGRMYRLTLNADGTLASKTQVAQLPCVDGLVIDRTTDYIFVCDEKRNIIHQVFPDGSQQIIAENGDTDGTDGRLDEPAEPLLRNNRLYISNFDVPQLGTINTKSDAPHTLSVIDRP